MFDCVLKNGWVLRDADLQTRAQPGWLGIEGEHIVAAGDGAPPAGVAEQAARVIDASGCLVTPGLINAHTHLSQTFMRGLAADRSLASWLASAVQPLQAGMTAEDVACASELGMVENIRCGVTTIVQHHKVTSSRAHVEAALRAASTTGIRMVLARGWRDIGARGEKVADIKAELRRLVGAWHGAAGGRLRIASGPMSPASCSTDAMKTLSACARDLGLLTHMHVAETAGEVFRFFQREGVSPIRWLDALGALNPSTQLVHCVHMDDADLRLIQRSGATVIHCPVSNMRLASGVASARRILDHGICLCVGTDGAASNDTQDLPETLKQTVMLANIQTGHAGAISPQVLLRLATASAARALAWPEIGKLKPGMKADISVFDLRGARTAPAHNPLASLIYSASGVRATHVWINGRPVLDDGRITTIDEQRLLTDAHSLASQLMKRAGVSRD
jgi:5-methylthioadenosine/S-adenosylhomocysteine deaminase